MELAEAGVFDGDGVSDCDAGIVKRARKGVVLGERLDGGCGSSTPDAMFGGVEYFCFHLRGRCVCA